MSNEELLRTIYSSTHHAAFRVSELFDPTVQMSAEDTRQQINKLATSLIVASAAATELNNRANGVKPPKQGN